MARVSRVVSQANTRAALITTARPLFRRDGFSATSMEAVAAAAGFSKGAVYSNFANKFELGYAVLDGIIEDQFVKMENEIRDAGTVADYAAGIGRWAEANIGDAEWTLLELELLTQARNDPAMRAQMMTRRQRLVDRLVDVLDDVVRRTDLELPMPTKDVVTLALSFGIGVGIQRTFDPTVSTAALAEAFSSLTGLPTDLSASITGA